MTLHRFWHNLDIKFGTFSQNRCRALPPNCPIWCVNRSSCDECTRCRSFVPHRVFPHRISSKLNAATYFATFFHSVPTFPPNRHFDELCNHSLTWCIYFVLRRARRHQIAGGAGRRKVVTHRTSSRPLHKHVLYGAGLSGAQFSVSLRLITLHKYAFCISQHSRHFFFAVNTHFDDRISLAQSRSAPNHRLCPVTSNGRASNGARDMHSTCFVRPKDIRRPVFG